MEFLNHLCDCAAAAGSCQPAHEDVIARRIAPLPFQRTQRTLLPDKTFALLRLRGSFKWNASSQRQRSFSSPSSFWLYVHF